MMAATLSPATRRGLFNTLISQEERAARERNPGKKKGSGEVIRVVMYECAECGDQFDTEDEAANCHPKEDEALAPWEIFVYCPVCDKSIGEGEYREATDCCLWKDFGPFERWAIADKVEAGATWAEAIAEATKG